VAIFSNSFIVIIYPILTTKRHSGKESDDKE
jgi:hypothetical protein